MLTLEAAQVEAQVTQRLWKRPYCGGAQVPYTSGKASPSGMVPTLMAISAMDFFLDPWLHGVYVYRFPDTHDFVNATSTGQNLKLPIACLCQIYGVCGCENTTDPSYFMSLSSNVSKTGMDEASFRTTDVHDTVTFVVNGTLANGTTAADETSLSNRSVVIMVGTLCGLAAVIVASSLWCCCCCNGGLCLSSYRGTSNADWHDC